MSATTLVAAEDLLRDPEREGRFELVRGELRERAVPNYRHGRVAVTTTIVLGGFVRRHELGDLISEGGYVFERDPDTVFLPDLSFVRADRVPPLDQQQGYPDLVPDLAIEVLSPSNTALEVAEKVHIYLETGVRLVWLLNPRQRSVTVHTPDRVARTLDEGDTLDGGDVLPGFAVRVGELFD
jgi:Uma2 family endonuclease